MTVFAPQFPPREPLWRLTVAQYHEMIDRGILTDDDPVELLEGWLITKIPKNPPHVLATELTADRLDAIKPAGWHVKRQDPITTEDSEPEPDVALVRGDKRDYQGRHPGSADVALVVEVADSTLERDRTLKMRAYARARIPIYWVINLIERRVEVLTDPTGPAEQPEYRSSVEHGETESIVVTIDQTNLGRVAVRDLLP